MREAKRKEKAAGQVVQQVSRKPWVGEREIELKAKPVSGGGCPCRNE